MKGSRPPVLDSFISYLRRLDKPIILLVLALSACGMIAIVSAVIGDPSKARCIPMQLIGIFGGLIIMFVVARIDYEFICKFYIPITIVSSALLLVTAIFADSQGGNYNWLTLGPVNIQTSEFTKTAFIVSISTHISKIEDQLNKPIHVLLLGVHFLFYFVPVILQHDLGSAIIYAIVFVFIIYAAGLKYRYFIIAAAAGAAAAPVIWQYLRVDQKKRIIYGFQPELDPLNYGYQPIIAKRALGSGQMYGLGFGNGIQTQNALLPANHTDFVFAIIGEEFGFVGCIVVLALIVALVVFILLNVTKIKNTCGRLICVGVAGILISQTLVNIGMVLGLAPVIGVTLPFVSYGGSSVMSLFFAMGMVQSVREKELTDNSLRFGGKARRVSPVNINFSNIAKKSGDN
jgi:rod shape determining protein RodA